MDDNAALNLIRETFENSFDRDRFLIFAKNIFKSFDESKAFHAKGYIKDQFKKTTPVIKTYERLGTFIDTKNNKIDILIVYLEKDDSLDRARTTQRNFVGDYLKDRDAKDAALVAFVTPSMSDWRLSLVKMDYHLGESKDGKLKAVTDLTPARRFSFLVGTDENTHTAQRQLLPIIKDTEFIPTLSDLEVAFSVEVVTKDFFEKYKKLFLDTKEALDAMIVEDIKIKSDFQEKNIDTADFAKKLLGQIVFLYFLQKKGWFGVKEGEVWGTGSKTFLRDLFDKKIIPYTNFFNDILEHLFYDALARDRSDIDHFNPHFKCKIPFLNGGLFDPFNNYEWYQTDILLPNELFSNNRKTKEGDTGDGILDVFDRYNFTVKEDEPLEREVAVDPEMLGKVFENLLEVKDRKSKGTYYTPREIVHYMCQESLINYLLTELAGKVKRDDIETLIRLGETAIEHDRTVSEHGEEKGRYTFKLPQSIRDNANILDEKLEKIHVCDPAVGSGAFLVGMMTEIIRVRNVLTNYLSDNERSIYDFKRHAIQNSLYGVDIDPGAVEIAKLRLWLSLIVDEEDIKQIKPLPNLDYKIMQGNSLLEEYEGIKLFDESIVTAPSLDNSKQIEEIKQKLNELQREFIKLHSSGELKGVKKQQIEAELKKYNDLLNKLTKAPKVKNDGNGLFDQMSVAKQKADDLKKLHQKFFETANKREKDEIKKKIETLEWDLIETTLREQNKLSQLPEIEHFKKANIKPFFLWKLNFSEIFEKNGGFDVVIANPPYVGEKGNEEIFHEILNTELGKKFYTRWMDYFYYFFHRGIDLGKKTATISFISTNYFLTATGGTKLRADLKYRTIIKHIVNFNELKIFETALGQHNVVTLLQKGQNENELAENCITYRQGISTQKILQTILSGTDKESRYFKVPQKDLYDGDNNYIRLSGSTAQSGDPLQSILHKVKKQGFPLNMFCNINQGIVSGADKVSAKHLLKYPNLKANKGDGIYILSRDEIQNISIPGHEHKKFVKPFFKNSDIKKYYTNLINIYYVLFIRDEGKPIKLSANLLSHFEKYRTLLTDCKSNFLKNYVARGIVQKWLDNGNYFVLFNPKKDYNYILPKIVAPQRSPVNTFGYNEIPWYASADVYFITQKDKSISLKYVLALLNSKLYYLWLYHRGKRKGETLELYQKPLSEIPIKQIEDDEQIPFVVLVDKILAITGVNGYLQSLSEQSKVSRYEEQIDQLVYKLYGLTPEEIKVVEGNND